MSRQYLFTSESVSEGHPDKLADQISDAILDAYLTSDRDARVACEVLLKNNTVVIAGEVRSNATVDHEGIARAVLCQVGYRSREMGFDAQACEVISLLSEQSADIARGVDGETPEDQGTGDQGMVFGYATIETPVLLPAPIWLAHRITHELAALRHARVLPWLRPDAKSQVTVRYQEDRPVAVDTIVVSTQHVPDITANEIERALRRMVIDQVIPNHWQDVDTRVLVNPTGCFEIGGPIADCGLTGRKIIVDTYGGMARHGGGAFSGKDPSKVDRSGAYAARYVACNIVAAGLAERCEVQIAYAIGVADPVSINVNTHGSGRIPDAEIADVITKVFDLRPGVIIRDLNLKRPIYQSTAAYGHFGRDELDLPWERRDRINAVREAALEQDSKIAFL